MLKYSIANCCNPIPGDIVFGFVSVKEGIKVHKKDCPNSISLRSNYAYRIITANWIDSENHEFNAKIELSGIDNIGLINNITSLISNSTDVNVVPKANPPTNPFLPKNTIEWFIVAKYVVNIFIPPTAAEYTLFTLPSSFM